jgi:hypothetical protein
MRVFTDFMTEKYAVKSTDPAAIRTITQTICTRIPTEAHAELENLITIDELQTAVARENDAKHQALTEYGTNSSNIHGK